MTIRITEGFDGWEAVEDGKTESFSFVEPVVANAAADLAEADLAEALAQDPKHPFMVYFMGQPTFRSSKLVPDRVRYAVLKRGMAANMFQVLDLRNGKVHQVEGTL